MIDDDVGKVYPIHFARHLIKRFSQAPGVFNFCATRDQPPRYIVCMPSPTVAIFAMQCGLGYPVVRPLVVGNNGNMQCCED